MREKDYRPFRWRTAAAHADAWRLRCDAARFAGARADYYEYLADMIGGLQGRKTLRDLFDDDAHRHGANSVRGRLARRWSIALERCGGDLSLAWKGSVPPEELALLHAAQRAGAAALTATLRDLARAARVAQEAMRIFRGALAAALAATAVACLLCAAVPYFTVPRLQAVFQGVAPAYYGTLTRRLFAFSDAVQASLPVLLAAGMGGTWLLLWSLPNLVGPWRSRLDGLPIWQLYRDINGIRFLAMLGVLVRQRGTIDLRLRQALILQSSETRPWLAWHIEAMIDRIDAGMAGADCLDTGLIEPGTWWYLSDMVGAHGLADGLSRAVARVQKQALRRAARQAAGLRWGLLFGALGVVLAITLWHYAVIDELRRALTNVYASG